MQIISQEYLKSILIYDPETGLFTWKSRPRSMFKTLLAFRAWNTKFAGVLTNSKNGRGYVTLRINYSTFMAHRMAWLYMTGSLPDKAIDHKDGITYNNKWSNLRLATSSQNNCNRKVHKNNKSGFKGVSYHKGNKRWEALIVFNGERKFIGAFGSAEAASKAYNEQSLLIHKEFSWTNQQI